jgi:hypothetical protein
VYIGGNKATVAWAGLAPGFAGVYQVNIAPTSVATGDVMMTCRTCRESNHVRLPEAPPNTGTNTANVSGKVTILYPAEQPKVTYTPAFVVAKTTAQFDIKPNAGKFTISVVAKIGTTTVDGTNIHFDPVVGQFTATVPAPTQAVRVGDFSALLFSGIQVLDFLSQCGSGNCPMPGNIVPVSRIDPTLVAALKLVPVPNAPPNGIHSSYTITGAATPGSTFVLGGTANLDLVTFGSFGSITAPTSEVLVSVTLYVDGQVIDAATTTYKPPQ